MGYRMESTDKDFKFIDLFAGAGGLSLGLEQAGFSVAFANEINKTCAETYSYNRNLSEKQIYVGDINKLNDIAIIVIPIINSIYLIILFFS